MPTKVEAKSRHIQKTKPLHGFTRKNFGLRVESGILVVSKNWIELKTDAKSGAGR